MARAGTLSSLLRRAGRDLLRGGRSTAPTGRDTLGAAGTRSRQLDLCGYEHHRLRGRIRGGDDRFGVAADGSLYELARGRDVPRAAAGAGRGLRPFLERGQGSRTGDRLD